MKIKIEKTHLSPPGLLRNIAFHLAKINKITTFVITLMIQAIKIKQKNNN